MASPSKRRERSGTYPSTGDSKKCETLDDVIECSYGLIGFDWLEPHSGDGVGEGGSADYYDVESSEFEMRSALEFIRPELTLSQLDVLEK